MIRVHGKWYDGQTSKSAEAVLEVFDNRAVYLKRVEDAAVLYHQKRIEATVSDRLANTPRFVSFPQGGTFETEDNANIDRILKQIQTGRWSLRVHALETRGRYILAATLLVVMCSAAAVTYGIPLAAEMIAPLLPRSVYTLAESQTLRILDGMVLKPSELDEETRRRIQDHVARAPRVNSGLTLQLLFRKGGRIGPNAFALPAGAIVFTDELVKISEHDDELLSIFFHEAGHVVECHAMRRVIQDSVLSFAMMALTGDSSGVSELFLGLPVLLMESAYSRKFENAADQYALRCLLEHRVPPRRFADILTRIETTDEKRNIHSGGKISGYLSTHPHTAERIKPFIEARPE